MRWRGGREGPVRKYKVGIVERWGEVVLEVVVVAMVAEVSGRGSSRKRWSKVR